MKDKYFKNSLHIKKRLNEIYEISAEKGNIELLDFLYNKYGIYDPSRLSKSLLNGYTEVIEWAMYRLIPMSIEYCNNAAASGKIGRASCRERGYISEVEE